MNSLKAPSTELTNKGRHVSNIEELGHEVHGKLLVIGDGKCFAIGHPRKDFAVCFVVQDIHEMLGKALLPGSIDQVFLGTTLDDLRDGIFRSFGFILVPRFT